MNDTPFQSYEDTENNRVDAVADRGADRPPDRGVDAPPDAPPDTLESQDTPNGVKPRRDRRAEQAVAASIPVDAGQYGECLLRLVRLLKNIPYLSGALPKDMEWILTLWRDLAFPKGSDWVALSIVSADFISAWNGYDRNKAELQVRAALESGQARNPGDPLTVLCRELQRLAVVSGSATFFLGCRTAGRMIGVGRTTAHKRLVRLQGLRVIKEVVGGKGNWYTGKASEWRYLGSLE